MEHFYQNYYGIDNIWKDKNIFKPESMYEYYSNLLEVLDKNLNGAYNDTSTTKISILMYAQIIQKEINNILWGLGKTVNNGLEIEYNHSKKITSSSPTIGPSTTIGPSPTISPSTRALLSCLC